MNMILWNLWTFALLGFLCRAFDHETAHGRCMFEETQVILSQTKCIQPLQNTICHSELFVNDKTARISSGFSHKGASSVKTKPWSILLDLLYWSIVIWNTHTPFISITSLVFFAHFQLRDYSRCCQLLTVLSKISLDCRLWCVTHTNWQWLAPLLLLNITAFCSFARQQTLAGAYQ